MSTQKTSNLDKLKLIFLLMAVLSKSVWAGDGPARSLEVLQRAYLAVEEQGQRQLDDNLRIWQLFKSIHFVSEDKALQVVDKLVDQMTEIEQTAQSPQILLDEMKRITELVILQAMKSKGPKRWLRRLYMTAPHALMTTGLTVYMESQAAHPIWGLFIWGIPLAYATKHFWEVETTDILETDVAMRVLQRFEDGLNQQGIKLELYGFNITAVAKGLSKAFKHLAYIPGGSEHEEFCKNLLLSSSTGNPASEGVRIAKEYTEDELEEAYQEVEQFLAGKQTR